ncbi:DUF4019 domain-containing protein [Pacificimonas pallii]|nr:DUF4019 domain-containing protein [Pacificimonas pallii]
MAASSPVSSSTAAPREVNVTADSETGWVPDVALEKAAMSAARDYFDLIDRERYGEAYAALDAATKAQIDAVSFADSEARFHEDAGTVKDRNLYRMTWTKYPPTQDRPGIYVAIDMAGTFSELARHCGYIVLFTPDRGTAFGVMRVERAYMTNATADAIRTERSETALEAEWAKLAASCPNAPPSVR